MPERINQVVIVKRIAQRIRHRQLQEVPSRLLRFQHPALRAGSLHRENLIVQALHGISGPFTVTCHSQDHIILIGQHGRRILCQFLFVAHVGTHRHLHRYNRPLRLYPGIHQLKLFRHRLFHRPVTPGLSGNLPMSKGYRRHNQLSIAVCRHLELVRHLTGFQHHHLRIGEPQLKPLANRRLGRGDNRENPLLPKLPLGRVVTHLHGNPLQR